MRAVIVGLGLLILALPAAASSNSQRGAELFNTSGCRHCHSIDRVGGHIGPDLSNVGAILTKKAIRKQIIDGGKQMPPFRHVLKRAEINDLVAYLHARDAKPLK